MTSYQTAFLELMQQRDMLYLELFVVVLVGWTWYKLWFKPFFKLVLGLSFLVIVACCAWGFYQLLPKDI